MRKPRKIDRTYTEAIQADVQGLLDRAGMFLPTGWRIYITDCNRGCCCHRPRYVRIPRWVIDINNGDAPSLFINGRWHNAKTSMPGYYIYYLAHELAHVMVGPGINHGPKYMEMFKRICPPELWHYELGYKPRLAKKAGITAREEMTA